MASRATWDAKYAAAERSIPEPDEFLIEAAAHLPQPGTGAAADIACGSGRHGLRLAQWGYRVTAFDYSVEALALCSDLASVADLPIETVRADLEVPDPDLGLECFDVVAVFNYLHRPLIPALKRSIRPGGVVIYKTYTRRQLQFAGGPRNPRFLLDENELPRLFADFRHLDYRETCTTEATAALVAQRP